jgi:hypothetical protein
MIPMVFAGMGGGNLPNASLEWAQHYMAQAHQQQIQLQQQQQQQLLPAQASPDQLQRRDSRVLSQHPYAPQQHTAPLTLPSTPVTSQGQAAFLPSYPISPTTRARQLAQGQTVTRAPQSSHLPRLNTGEMHIQPPPSGPLMQVLPGQPAHPLQQSTTAASAQQESQSQSSPSIYFHHWQPPTSQAASGSANQPTTPSGEQTSSPKKRKATGPQQAAPPPTSQPQYTSPSFSQTGSSVSNTPSSRRRGHSRQRSDMSARGLESYRPPSRHRHTESTFSVQSMTSPPQPEQGQSSMSSEPRSGGSNPVSSILEQSESRPTSQHHYSGGSEVRREEPRRTPSDEDARRAIRDDGRD